MAALSQVAGHGVQGAGGPRRENPPRRIAPEPQGIARARTQAINETLPTPPVGESPGYGREQGNREIAARPDGQESTNPVWSHVYRVVTNWDEIKRTDLG